MALETVTEDPGTQTQLRRSQPQRELGAVGEVISGSVGLKDSERDLERLHCTEVMERRCLSLQGMAQSTIEGNLHPLAREAGKSSLILIGHRPSPMSGFYCYEKKAERECWGSATGLPHRSFYSPEEGSGRVNNRNK